MPVTLAKTLTKTFVFCAIVAMVAGCGKKSNNQPQTDVFKLAGSEYRMLEKGTLKATDTAITGTGTVLFKDALVDKDNNFAVSFTLEQGGSLTLITNSSDDLKGGMRVTFHRNQESLAVSVRVGDSKEENLPSEKFTSFRASSSLEFAVDVHTDHGHIIFFKNETEKSPFYEHNINVDKQTFGKLWGLALNNATISKAKAGKAKEEHND